MSYSVHYNQEFNRKYPKQENQRQIPIRKIIILAIIFVSFYIMAQTGWYKYLLPGNPEVTSSALTTLTERVGNGESIKDAVYCFCEEIINGGK